MPVDTVWSLATWDRLSRKGRWRPHKHGRTAPENGSPKPCRNSGLVLEEKPQGAAACEQPRYTPSPDRARALPCSIAAFNRAFVYDLPHLMPAGGYRRAGHVCTCGHPRGRAICMLQTLFSLSSCAIWQISAKSTDRVRALGRVLLFLCGVCHAVDKIGSRRHGDGEHDGDDRCCRCRNS